MGRDARRPRVSWTQTPTADGPNIHLEVATLLSSRTKEGLVELALGGVRTQMDLDKAREVIGMLQGAVEAAISDMFLYRFLIAKIGLDEQRAAHALVEFRIMRQGGEETIYKQ